MYEPESTFYEHLEDLYGEEQATAVLPRLEALVDSHRGTIGTRQQRWFNEQDVVLITYGDMVSQSGEVPLETLANFLNRQVADSVNTVHILPFFPHSSDDGFSVIDYCSVDPELGDWGDVRRIGESFKLMFDAVVNHVSAESDWFQGFLRDDPLYREYFTVVDPDADTTFVFRPRTLPVLTEVDTSVGPRNVWTTFSPDQIDLNYENPDVLLAVIDTLLFHIAQGAMIIRLDAIAFIWKQLGTACIHLPETHRIIQLIRCVLDSAAADVAIVTETNVPHSESISNFGDGSNEAHMVYNFALPPLTLHAFHTGTAGVLSRWARDLEAPLGRNTFLNFLASHDGIGVGGAQGMLTEDEIFRMTQRIEQLGGSVSCKTNSDNTQSACELNSNFLDALEDPSEPINDIGLVTQRFLTSQAIMLAPRGVPATYFHSLFGSRRWSEGVESTGMARSVNRERLDLRDLNADLANQESLRRRIFDRYENLIRQRISHAAFSPDGDQYVIPTHQAVFALLRVAPEGGSFVLCLHNVSREACNLVLNLTDIPLATTIELVDLVGNGVFSIQRGELYMSIEPYQTLWLAGEAWPPPSVR